MPHDRLRLLVVTNMWPSGPQPARGVFVRDQVRALRALDGVEVDVCVIDGVRRPWRYATAAARLPRRADGHDVVHVHYGLTGLAVLGLPRRLPVVLTVHGRDCHHPLVRRVTALVGRRAAAVVAVSDELARICPVRVDEVIPTGVNTGLFRAIPRTEAREQLGLPTDGRFVLFPADRARPEKRYELAQELVGAVPGLEVHALSGRPRHEVPLWINAADAVVVTSEREGYGLACVEALACDVPVLSTPVGVAPTILSGVEGTLCAPFDVDVWRAHLTKILESDDPRVEGRALAETHSVSASARRLLDVYRRVRAS